MRSTADAGWKWSGFERILVQLCILDAWWWKKVVSIVYLDFFVILILWKPVILSLTENVERRLLVDEESLKNFTIWFFYIWNLHQDSRLQASHSPPYLVGMTTVRRGRRSVIGPSRTAEHLNLPLYFSQLTIWDSDLNLMNWSYYFHKAEVVRLTLYHNLSRFDIQLLQTPFPPYMATFRINCMLWHREIWGTMAKSSEPSPESSYQDWKCYFPADGFERKT